jgi:hypothetical protein
MSFCVMAFDEAIAIMQYGAAYRISPEPRLPSQRDHKRLRQRPELLT